MGRVGSSWRRLGAAAIGIALLGTARCPVGCRPGNPPRSTWADPVQIPIEKIGPCQFRIVGEIPRKEGTYGCHLYDESLIIGWHWRLDGGVLTTFGYPEVCNPDAGIPRSEDIELVFYEIVPVGGPE